MISKEDQLDGEGEPPRLSFCDLAQCTSDSSGDYSDITTSSSSAPQESFIFDFFSSGFTPPENIIFCGRQLVDNGNGNGQLKSTRGLKKKVFHWTKTMFGGSSPRQAKQQQRSKKKPTTATKTYYYDQVSSKSSRRWLMLMFGSMRVPNEMDLADIKIRQRRRVTEPKSFVAMFEDHEQQQRKKVEADMGTGRSCLIGGIVRSFSCKGLGI